MNYFDAIILGAVQGITEFLPISSSGHLVILEDFLGLKVEELKEFDILLHFATLFSILIYFWKDIFKLIKLLPSWLQNCFAFAVNGFKKVEKSNNEANIISFLIIGSIPAGILGIFFGDIIDELFRDSKMVSVMLIFSAILFIVAEFIFKKIQKISKLNEIGLIKAFFIGTFQALALIPGVSRSGSTISAGIMSGIKREDSAKFSFFLGSIAIFGASVITLKDLDFFNNSLDLGILLAGFLSSFSFGILSIGFLMKFLKKHSLLSFSIYLIFFAGISYFFL